MKDRSNPWEGDSPMRLMVSVTIADGKLDQFDAVVKNEWMPLRKKLGLPGPIVYQPLYGERRRRLRVMASPLDDWASLDEPNPFIAKGGDAARAARAKLLENVVDSKWIVTQFRSDLSYVP